LWPWNSEEKDSKKDKSAEPSFWEKTKNMASSAWDYTKSGVKAVTGGIGGAVGAGLGAVGGGITGAGMGAYKGATGAYDEAKMKAGGGIMGTIAGLGAGLMGGLGGLVSGGAVGAVGGAAYGGLAGGKLGSGDAEGAGTTFGDFIDGGLKAGGHIKDGAKSIGKGVGSGAAYVGGKISKGLDATKERANVLGGKISEKAGKYYDKEIDDDEFSKEGGFMKGAVGGALGTVGGLLGGLYGGIKGATGFGDKKEDGTKNGIWDQMKASGTKGRNLGRVAGSGIVDGTKAIVGGVAGVATGAVGGALGGLTGIGHGIYNKVKGKGNFFDTVKKDAAIGAKGGYKLGKGATNAGFGLVEEVPELAMNLSRGALGAAGGVVGGAFGGIYGGIKGAIGKGDKVFDKNGKEKRLSAWDQMKRSGKSGVKKGANFGANSNLTRNVLGTGAVMAATLGGGLLGGPAGLSAGYTAAHANSRYWGKGKSQADVKALTSTIGSATGGLINNTLPGLENPVAPISSDLAVTGAKIGNSTAAFGAGIGLGMGVNKVEGKTKEDKRGFFKGKWEDEVSGSVDKRVSLGNKAKQQKNRVKKLFGF